MRDTLGNLVAREGCDRCPCGAKYWEADRCIDCGTPIATLLDDPGWRAENRPDDLLDRLQDAMRGQT